MSHLYWVTTNLTSDFSHFRTDHFIYSNRMVGIWNRLPTDLRQEQSLDGFVRKLNSFYYIKFQNTFNCALGQDLVDVRRVLDFLIIIINMYQPIDTNIQYTWLNYHRYYCNLYCWVNSPGELMGERFSPFFPHKARCSRGRRPRPCWISVKTIYWSADFQERFFLFDPSLPSGMSAALMQGHCLRRRPCIKQHMSGGREYHRKYHRQLPTHLTRHETLPASGLD